MQLVGTPLEIIRDTLQAALDHHTLRDEANAMLHLAKPQYRPLTELLRAALHHAERLPPGGETPRHAVLIVRSNWFESSRSALAPSPNGWYRRVTLVNVGGCAAAVTGVRYLTALFSDDPDTPAALTTEALRASLTSLGYADGRDYALADMPAEFELAPDGAVPLFEAVPEVTRAFAELAVGIDNGGRSGRARARSCRFVSLLQSEESDTVIRDDAERDGGSVGTGRREFLDLGTLDLGPDELPDLKVRRGGVTYPAGIDTHDPGMVAIVRALADRWGPLAVQYVATEVAGGAVPSWETPNLTGKGTTS